MVTRAVECEQELQPERQKLKMEVTGEFVKKHEFWDYSKQGKNYIAEVTGLSKRFRFQRKFLDLIYRGREKHFLLKDFVPGHLYEIVSVYCINKRKSHPQIQSIFECISIGEEVLFKEVFESEVLERFSEVDTMTVPEILVKQLLTEVSKAEAVELIEEMQKNPGND